MPGFGAMRSFWFSMGMLRVWAMVEERSWRVASGGRVKVCGLPWWWTVRVISDVDESVMLQLSSSQDESDLGKMRVVKRIDARL
jgi:hypothetical protein